MHPRSCDENYFLNNLRPVLVLVQQGKVDRVDGFEPMTSAAAASMLQGIFSTVRFNISTYGKY